MPQVSMLVWNDFRHDARVLKEAQTLVSGGYQVTVHALLTPGLTPEHQILAPGLSVRRVPRSPWELDSLAKQGGLGIFWKVISRTAAHVRFLYRLINERSDVIHAHDVNVLPTAWLAARLTGAKIVYDAHEISTSREGYRRIRHLVGWIEKILMPRMDATITTTDARAKFFSRAYGVPRPLVLQNRPRLDLLQVGSRIRVELEFFNPWPVIVYQGGMQQGRGLERLVQAMATVPNAYLAMIGGGRLTEDLKQLADDLSLTARVRFIPTVPLAQLPSYSAGADIGVQPILNTCFNHATTDSNKLFEYIMAGLPIVASDLPEIRLIVERNEVGELVDQSDPEQLAKVLRRLVQEPELRRRYRENSLKARQHLNWEAQERQLVSLYANLFYEAPTCVQ